jgi:putative DNA primase/helicase
MKHDANSFAKDHGSDALRDELDKADRFEPKPDDIDAIPPAFSDSALALRFVELHADDLRFVAEQGRWFKWNGKWWQFDRVLGTGFAVWKICNVAAAECNKPGVSRMIASAKTIAAVERLARCSPRLAATAEQWDADPWLLNTTGGIVDLRTGKIGKHRPEAFCTKITAVAPDVNCPIIRWLKFLHRITGGARPTLFPIDTAPGTPQWWPPGDEKLIAFLQRVFGYALTGSTRDQAMFFAHGGGANGKTILINLMANIMGSYHTAAPIATFTAQQFDRHPTDLADLCGARLVTAVETEEGRQWAESKIKALTGGDKIKARFMRQDFFEYTPQFKLLVAGNHKPGLTSVDTAIRRRLHLIPFTVTIDDDERCDVAEMLKEEWPGILHWAIQGCLDWQSNGLNPPPAVRDATERYFEAEDTILSWIEECCERDPYAVETTARLYSSFTAHSIATGEITTITKRRFTDSLAEHGFERQRDKTERGFRGLRLRPER